MFERCLSYLLTRCSGDFWATFMQCFEQFSCNVCAMFGRYNICAMFCLCNVGVMFGQCLGDVCVMVGSCLGLMRCFSRSLRIDR